MNVTMREVVFVDGSHNKTRFESFFVQNRLIRFVQVPTEIDIKSAMKRMFDPNLRGRNRGQHEFKLSGGRKSIMRSREKRRQEDLTLAQKFLEEKQQQSDKQ